VAKQAELAAADLESAEKALYLADIAYRTARDNFEARQVYAQALRKNAFMQKSAYKRNYYLSAALALGAETLVTDFAKTGDENTVLTFRTAEFSQHFFGLSGAGLETVMITNLPPAEHGVLALAGVSVSAGQEIPAAELDGLTFTPTGDWNGETSFTWNGASGGTYAAKDAPVTITIAALNDAPMLVNPPADITVDEDAASVTLNLAEVFTDVDGDPLSYKAESSNPDLVSVSLENAIVTLDFLSEQHGAATITISAADVTGEQAAAWTADDLPATVNPVNDTPSANDGSQLVTAGLGRTFTLDYDDIETAAADLTVVFDGPAHGLLDTSALPDVTYTAPDGYIGTDSFTFTVTDRGDPDGCAEVPCSGALQAQATVSLEVAENSIKGRIYNDANANGLPDEGEDGMAGGTVRLIPLDGSPARETVSGEDGSYAFTSLLPGAYQVRQTPPPGYLQTTSDPADIDLVMGQAVGGVDFGVVQSADVSVTITTDVNNMFIVYTLMIANAGPADALDVALNGMRPHGVIFTSVHTRQGTCYGHHALSCQFDTIAAGGNVTVVIKALRTDRWHPIDITFLVTSGTFDINLDNNTATAQVK